MDKRQGTHWEGCWREHHECAIARIVALGAERERRDAEALARSERAYERGEHEAREESRQEKAAKMREWDIATGKWIP